MKILHIGNFAKKSSPLGYCPNAEWMSKTFEQLGHKVDRYNEAELSAMDAMGIINRGNYDMLFCEEGRLRGDFLDDERHKRDILRREFWPVMRTAKNNGVQVVPWLTNIFYGIMRREVQIKQNPIFKASIVFTTDGGHQKEFEEAGVNHVLLRQGIFQDEAYLTEEKYETPCEIGFIGGIYENIWPYREKMVKWLEERG